MLKGILDALFPNDKIVYAGAYECSLSPEQKGHVNVILEIEEDDWKGALPGA